VCIRAPAETCRNAPILAPFAFGQPRRDPCTLYLLTFALDSVGDVFGSFFMLGSGLLVLATRVLPRWLGWVAVAASPFLLVQAFGLGGSSPTSGSRSIWSGSSSS
jgi:hypothetical protein